MTLNNLMLHITLPAGIKTASGATLRDDITFDLISTITPFYASIDQVKLTGGIGLRKLSDIAIAGQIYMASKQVDMLNFNNPQVGAGHPYYQFVNARNQWVTNRAAMDLTLSLGNLLSPSSHVLANFSVTNQKNSATEGTAGKLSSMERMLTFYDPTIRSGGVIEPGGHARPKFAAKGVMDWTERSPGRQWSPNSPGANTQTFDFGNPATGGRGKPLSYFAPSIFSPSISGYRFGNFQAGRPLALVGGGVW